MNEPIPLRLFFIFKKFWGDLLTRVLSGCVYVADEVTNIAYFFLIIAGLLYRLKASPGRLFNTLSYKTLDAMLAWCYEVRPSFGNFLED